MYIIISTPLTPKIAHFLAEYFQSVFSDRQQNRLTFLCRNVGMKEIKSEKTRQICRGLDEL